MEDLHVALKTVLVPLATLCGWIANALPPIAALASILWIGFQWYHSAPMKERRRLKGKKK
jgi:hypothetical protein